MQRINNDIKTGNYQPVYLLYGEERYLKKQYKDKLKKALVGIYITLYYNYLIITLTTCQVKIKKECLMHSYYPKSPLDIIIYKRIEVLNSDTIKHKNIKLKNPLYGFCICFIISSAV